MQRKVILWLTVVGMVLVLPLSAMSSSLSSTPAGKYGTLYGENGGFWVDARISVNDGTGTLSNKWNVLDHITGSLYTSGSDSCLGCYGLGNATYAEDYPYPTTVTGIHEVRNREAAYVVYTVTIY